MLSLEPMTPEEAPLSSPPPFEEMWMRVRPKLRGVLARYGIPIQDGEDLIQKTFVHYWYKRDQVREPERWLPVALGRTCLMYWRSQGRSLTVAVDESLLEVIADKVAPAQERKVMRGELARMLKKVKAKCREIIQMRYLGYDRHEIADETGYKVSGIDKVTQRCIDDLGRRFRKAAAGLCGRTRPERSSGSDEDDA